MNILSILFWVHLLGVAIWVGGSLLMPLVIMPAVQILDAQARQKFMMGLSARLTPWMTVSILAVVISGIAQTGIIYGFAYLKSINVLTIKLAVTLLMIGNGFYVGAVLTKKVGQLSPQPDSPPTPQFLRALRMLAMHSWIQAGLAVLVLFLVALLTS